MVIYLSNPPTLKEYYASLFGSDQSTGSLQAQKWDPITTAIHAPLLNIRGTFIGMGNVGIYELSNRTFTPTTKTRASAKNNPKRHQTIWYEFGLAKNLMYREGAKELLQGSFTAAETYERINAIVQFESTYMIIIHAHNTSIVTGPHDPVVLSNHTIIAACTYHRFNTTKAGITNCFISYLAVTNKQYTRDTVTGFAEKERPHKPFRDGGYGFSWLLIRMASLLSGTNLPARGKKTVSFARVYLQVQKCSAARSIFLHKGFVPASPLNSEQLAHLEQLISSKQQEMNYQNSQAKDIESLHVYGKICCSGQCLSSHSNLTI